MPCWRGSFRAKQGFLRKLVSRTDADFKEELPRWLEGANAPDVFYWQASQRLFALVKQGKIEPITHLWRRTTWTGNSGMRGLPWNTRGPVWYSLFLITAGGIYYRKSLLKTYGGPAEELGGFCSDLHTDETKGHHPIAIGTENAWPAAAWFDYLNLRINGLPFHQQLLAGEVSFPMNGSERSLPNGENSSGPGFTQNSAQYDWSEVLPLLYRNKSGLYVDRRICVFKISEEIKVDF